MSDNPTTRSTGLSFMDWVRAARVDGFASTVLWLFGVSVFSFFLRWPFLSLPMISDEGGYAYAAQRWLDGRGTLYDDLWVSRPQGIFLAYSAIFHTIGDSVVALRVGAWLVGLLTMLVVWSFASRWGGRRVARMATLLFAVISASPAIEGFTANAEVFLALPAAGAVMLLWRAFRYDWRAHHLFLAGLLIGVATLLKPSGIVMLPVAYGFALLASEQSFGLVLKRSLWVTGGFLAALAPAFIHGYLIGWDNFVFAAITYRITHQSSATNSPAHHIHALIDLVSRIWPLLAAGLLPFLVRWWAQGEGTGVRTWSPRISEARIGIVSLAVARPRIKPGDEGTLLLRLWMLGCLAGIAMGGDWWFHYLIQIAAPFSIWLAATVLDVRTLLSERGRWLMAIGIALLLMFPYSVVAKGDSAAITKAIYGHPGYPDQVGVATYLKSHSPPNTPIFVAFDQAALYYLADRPSIYRYLYDQELRALPESQEELIAIIESPNRPMYIVGTRQVAPFPDRGRAFWGAVGRHYHLEATVRGVPIYRANIIPLSSVTPGFSTPFLSAKWG
ncbi:MAG: glycosyltransferase family 39 protein [Thermomicrobiales bacterium]|nr:glycosyltransferase family 39 protein [Thermomicrobiales bacterium]